VGNASNIGETLNWVTINLIDDPAGLASSVDSRGSSDNGRGGSDNGTGGANVNALGAGRNRNSCVGRGLLGCGNLGGVIGSRLCNLARV